MPEFNITEWDPTSMAPDATILIVGKRHTGKTTLTRDLMLHMKNRLELVVGMNPTEMGNHNLEFFTPKSFIFHSFDDQKLHHILDWQKRSVANNKARRIGFIMDDCMSETSGGAGGKKKKVMSSGDISKIFKIGRHFKIFYICTMQYICDAPPEIRGNVDLLFVFNTTSGLEREKLWKDYFAQFQKYKDFCKVFDACAVGYDCMVLDTRKAASNANCIFYYRAKMIEEPFQVGRSIYWKLSEYYFTDKTDYDMDASKVLGVLPRNLEPVPLENDDHLVIRRN